MFDRRLENLPQAGNINVSRTDGGNDVEVCGVRIHGRPRQLALQDHWDDLALKLFPESENLFFKVADGQVKEMNTVCPEACTISFYARNLQTFVIS